MGEIIQFPSRDVQMEFIDSLNETQLETFMEIIRMSMAELDKLDRLFKQKCEECKKLKKQIKELKETKLNEK